MAASGPSAWLAFLLWVVSALACAAQPAEPPRPRAELQLRYLFVVDNSFSMKRYWTTIRHTVSDLIKSGFNNQIRHGEGFGVWVFSEDTYTRRFPILHWDAALSTALMNTTDQFLKAQVCEGQTKLDRAVREINDLAARSSLLTVFLISDGAHELRGTPFDSLLNTIYKDNHAELRKKRMPFVTALLVRDGRVVAWTVSQGGSTIDLPLPAGEFQVAKAPPAEVKLEVIPATPGKAVEKPAVVPAAAPVVEPQKDPARPPVATPVVRKESPPQAITPAPQTKPPEAQKEVEKGAVKFAESIPTPPPTAQPKPTEPPKATPIPPETRPVATDARPRPVETASVATNKPSESVPIVAPQKAAPASTPATVVASPQTSVRIAPPPDAKPAATTTPPVVAVAQPPKESAAKPSPATNPPPKVVASTAVTNPPVVARVSSLATNTASPKVELVKTSAPVVVQVAMPTNRPAQTAAPPVLVAKSEAPKPPPSVEKMTAGAATTNLPAPTAPLLAVKRPEPAPQQVATVAAAPPERKPGTFLVLGLVFLAAAAGLAWLGFFKGKTAKPVSRSLISQSLDDNSKPR